MAPKQGKEPARPCYMGVVQSNHFHFIKPRQEILFGEFTDEVPTLVTREYPSMRYEMGIGDEWKTNLHNLLMS